MEIDLRRSIMIGTRRNDIVMYIYTYMMKRDVEKFFFEINLDSQLKRRTLAPLVKAEEMNNKLIEISQC